MNNVDFMNDSLNNGRRFRTFNVLDDCNREALAIEVDLNLSVQRIVRVLKRIASWCGYPNKIRMDNRPEFISVTRADWAEENGIRLAFIQPGTPTQNSYIERFNHTYREAVLDRYVFRSLNEVRELTEKWMREYNEERPHDSLGDLTPWEYLALHQPAETSTLLCH